MYSIHAVYNSVYVEYVIKGDLKLLSGTVLCIIFSFPTHLITFHKTMQCLISTAWYRICKCHHISYVVFGLRLVSCICSILHANGRVWNFVSLTTTV